MIVNERAQDAVAGRLDLAAQAVCGNIEFVAAHQLDQLLMLRAHLDGKVAEIETEEEEPLHAFEEIPEHRHQALVARQLGEPDMEGAIAVEKIPTASHAFSR